jgi:hypothetical protein
MAIEQLVSVGNVIVRDPTTKAGLFYGIANINSSISVAMENAEARGGIGNQLFYKYFHTKKMTLDIEQAAFTEQILAMQSGVSIVTGNATVVQTDCLVTSASSAAQVTLTPSSVVTVFLANGDVQTVTASGKDITLSGVPSQKVTAIYETSKSVDRTTIEAYTPPKIVDLTLIAQVRDQSTSGVKKYFQVNIPSFQLDGAYDLSLTANGISTEKLSGEALAVESTDCTTETYYATVSYVPVTTVSSYTSIATIPGSVEWAKSSVQSTQFSVLGIRGGTYSNTNITSDCTFARSGSSGSGIVITSAGLAYASASGVTIPCTIIISASYASGSLVDYAAINVT